MYLKLKRVKGDNHIREGEMGGACIFHGGGIYAEVWVETQLEVRSPLATRSRTLDYDMDLKNILWEVVC
jgi:hypothetical protein